MEGRASEHPIFSEVVDVYRKADLEDQETPHHANMMREYLARDLETRGFSQQDIYELLSAANQQVLSERFEEILRNE